MSALREIVAARAKVPAKIHSMEANGPKQSAVTPTGGPIVVKYSAGQVVADSGSTNVQPPRQPPRAPGSGTPGSNVSGATHLRKPSEARKPRSSSESRSGPTDGPDNALEGRAPAPKAKARASSLNRAKIGDNAPPIDRKDVGKVPAYLRRRQNEMAEEKRLANRPHSPQAPPGYRKVPDSEKEATLEVLRQRKKEVEAAQRNLPFKIETAGQRQREKDLTDRLAHLDKLLGMFAQPVVFIPADAEPIAVSVPPLPQGLQGRPPRERESDRPEVSITSHTPELRRAPERESNLAEDGARHPSRENRARANAERRAQVGVMAPWDRGNECPSALCDVRTAVQVMAPPGGKSNFSLAWD